MMNGIRRLRRAIEGVAIGAVGWCAACNGGAASGPQRVTPVALEPDQPEEAQAAAWTPYTPSGPVEIPPGLGGPPQWLKVTKVRDDAPGGVATGDFDPERNKLEIHTSGVAAFTIDTSQLRINWDRLVIIGIDGRNSELRRRDEDVLHLVREGHGQWTILEEPAGE